MFWPMGNSILAVKNAYQYSFRGKIQDGRQNVHFFEKNNAYIFSLAWTIPSHEPLKWTSLYTIFFLLFQMMYVSKFKSIAKWVKMGFQDGRPGNAHFAEMPNNVIKSAQNDIERQTRHNYIDMFWHMGNSILVGRYVY